jgi:hypothetical protein
MTSDAYVGWYGKGREQAWRTPPELFDPLHERYQFTLDGAADPGNGLLPRASTVLAPIPWDGERVFCNPPWSNIAPFVEQAPAAELCVMLVPARTNAKWFHRALELGAGVSVFKGRPRFLTPEGDRKHGSPVDCLYLVWND